MLLHRAYRDRSAVGSASGGHRIDCNFGTLTPCMRWKTIAMLPLPAYRLGNTDCSRRNDYDKGCLMQSVIYCILLKIDCRAPFLCGKSTRTDVLTFYHRFSVPVLLPKTEQLPVIIMVQGSLASFLLHSKVNATVNCLPVLSAR